MVSNPISNTNIKNRNHVIGYQITSASPNDLIILSQAKEGSAYNDGARLIFGSGNTETYQFIPVPKTFLSRNMEYNGAVAAVPTPGQQNTITPEGSQQKQQNQTVQVFTFQDSSKNPPPDFTVDGFTSVFDEFKNTSRIFFKTNEATGNQRDINFLFGRSQNCFREDLAFNSPNGTLQRIRAVGMTFLNNLGKTITGSVGTGAIGTASGQDVVFALNLYGGRGGTCAHLEERVRRASIMGNVGIREEAKAGISSQSNNVKSVPVPDNIPHHPYNWPKNVAVLGNVLQGSRQPIEDPPNPSKGFAFIADQDLYPGGEAHAVGLNVFSNWNVGIRTSELTGHNLLTSNVINDCDVAVKVNRPATTIKDTMVIDCDKFLESDTTGFIGSVFLVQSETDEDTLPPVYDGSSVYIDSVPDAVNDELAKDENGNIILDDNDDPVIIIQAMARGVTEWNVNIDKVNFASGGLTAPAKPYPIIPIGKFMTGRITLALFFGPGRYRIAVFDVTYDDITETFTSTQVTQYGESSIVEIDSLQVISDNLCIMVTNKTETPFPLGGLQMRMHNGYHVW